MSCESSSFDEVRRTNDKITHKINQNSKDSFSKNSGSLVNEEDVGENQCCGNTPGENLKQR